MAKVFNTVSECTGCQRKARIINARFTLCGVCNGKRLRPDKSTKPGRTPKKPQKKPKQISDKRRERLEKLAAAKAIVKARDLPICTGCGRPYAFLSYSHIVPVSQMESLEAEPENIVFDCLTVGRVNPRGNGPNDLRGCHELWEHGSKQDRERLLNYNYRIEKIKELAPDKYRELKSKGRI